ncbi:pneumococcal serine-rich repeat protein-like isoform X1 [Macrobrachium rosenbergii]|uniref:pneumococcal serine-rich repeat protein-like isoform X1 n=1 Tax=Macrobrachium rosenbergii TaxID=79674 RepID=UPI0034D554C6
MTETGRTLSPKLVLWFLAVAISSRPTVATVVWYPARVGASYLLNSILDLPVANELSCAMKATKMANFNLWCYENERCSLYDMDVLPFTDHSDTDTTVHCMTRIPVGNSSSSSSSSSTIFSTSTVTSPISSTAATETTATTLTSASTSAPASTTTLTSSATTTTLPATTTTTESTTTTTFTTAVPDTSTTTAVTTSTTAPTTSTTTTAVTTTSTTTPTTTTAAIQSLCTIVNQLGCIYLVDTMSTWYQAKAGCEGLGGHLYNAETEQQFLDLVYHARSNYYPRYVWMGVKNRTWTLTSRPVSTKEWDYSEPNGPLESCGYMNRGMDYYLADYDCTDPSPYLCQL